VRKLWLVALLMGCETATTELVGIQFNGMDDAFDVGIVASDELGSVSDIELLSTTGAVVVGTASLDPSTGPVGTDHLIQVDISDDWEEVVSRVTVLVDAGDRGNAEYEFIQDSADHGYWETELTSLGEEGETRTDTFTLQLWQSEDTADLVVEEADEETSE
jgi:hypothetical protein